MSIYHLFLVGESLIMAKKMISKWTLNSLNRKQKLRDSRVTMSGQFYHLAICRGLDLINFWLPKIWFKNTTRKNHPCGVVVLLFWHRIETRSFRTNLILLTCWHIIQTRILLLSHTLTVRARNHCHSISLFENLIGTDEKYIWSAKDIRRWYPSISALMLIRHVDMLRHNTNQILFFSDTLTVRAWDWQHTNMLMMDANVC